MEPIHLETRVWWSYLDGNQRDLFDQSRVLLEREEHEGGGLFEDYAFIVFPAAKAYEGFLKKVFLDLDLVSRNEFEGDHFRIGRSLNPSLPERFRGRDWIYQRLSEACGGKKVPNVLWDVWKESRNVLFHWFPKNRNAITLEEAHQRLESILTAMDTVFASCTLG